VFANSLPLYLRQLDRRRGALSIGAIAVTALAALSLASAGVLYLGTVGSSRPASLGEALVMGMSDWLVWPALIPAVVWLSREFPIGRSRWASGFLVHLMASTVVALTAIAVTLGICAMGGLPYRSSALWEVKLSAIGEWFHFGFLVYWVIVAGVHAVEYHRGLRYREVEAAEIQTQLARAQLQALRMQLHPHFLFNTLHTVATYVRDRRADEAVDMIANLGDLLRTSLERGERQEVSLQEEVDFVQRYLEIERVRFSDRMRVEIRILPETRAARVPAMILQPLVENAVRHGVAPSPSAGLIEISAWRQAGMLCLRVRDDGPGFGALDESPPGSQVGLRNTVLRLERLYGGGERLHMENHQDGGAVVTLTIPWHTEPLSAAPGGEGG